jgi:hypothetical protein
VHIDAHNLTFSWEGFQKFISFLLLYIIKKWAESLATKASIHWPFESACVSILLTSDAGEHLEAPSCAAGNCKANSVAKMGQGSAVLSPIAHPVANLVLVSPFGKQGPLLRWLWLLRTTSVFMAWIVPKYSRTPSIRHCHCCKTLPLRRSYHEYSHEHHRHPATILIEVTAAITYQPSFLRWSSCLPLLKFEFNKSRLTRRVKLK